MRSAIVRESGEPDVKTIEDLPEPESRGAWRTNLRVPSTKSGPRIH